MRLSKLLEKLTDIRTAFYQETEIETLSIDSTQKQENGLYFCLSGGKLDGHNFAEQALKNGAVALVVEREMPLKVPQIIVKNARETLSLLSAVFYGEPAERLKIIAVTGTNGKTTTAHMLASILETDGKKVGIIGTLGAKFLGETRKSNFTTPDPIELNAILCEMLAKGIEYVVMEVSAHALYYKKTLGLRFFACIFANLTQDHLDFFSSMTAYKQAKSSLFTDEVCPLAVINGDDENGRAFAENRANKTLYYGLNTPTDAFAIVTEESLHGSKCMLNLNDKLCRVTLSMTGRHNIYNALAASTCAYALGVGISSIASGLTALKGVDGRLEFVAKVNQADVFVDFAHTPDGLEKSLTALKKHCKGRLICLFGCGGNRDKSKRPIMGERVAKFCDFAVLTSDNPRFEDPLDILSQVEKGYRRFSLRYVIVPDRKRAIAYALDTIQKHDVLLVAGKGGEEYQEIMGIKYPFSDNDIIAKYIMEKMKTEG